MVLMEAGKELGIESASPDRAVLVAKVNELINTNFEYLVSILYRIDVSEKKLGILLKEHPERIAAETIVDLMLERQAEKIKSRSQTKKEDDIAEEEKW